MTIKTGSFVEERKRNWEELSGILNRVEKNGLSSLGEREIDRLSELYRSVCSDLSHARDGIKDERLSEYLNLLAARAHNCIYRREPLKLRNLLRFYRYRFPEIFRRTRNYTLSSFLCFAVFAVLGYITAMRDESFPDLIIPHRIMESIEKGEMWTSGITTIAPQASSAIMTNNITVTFAAFALGVTFGVGTIYILGLNGLLLGTLSCLIQNRGMGVPFWSFVFPHGIIELSAIFIAGGAGLLLAGAQLVSTDLGLKDRFVLRGRLAVKLILGCIPVLIVAGIVEGFFSPLPGINPAFKFAMGIILGFLLWFYLLFSK